MDEEENNDLTPDEEIDMEETGETEGEAHREGEFDDIRDRLDGIATMLEGMRETIALFVSDGGARIKETGEDETPVDIDEIPGIDDFDLSI